MSHPTQPIPIALDSNALKFLFRHHDHDVFERVEQGRLQIYVPVIVYAEQVIYPGYAIDNVVLALNARVVPLHVDHARRLGKLWGQRSPSLTHQHDQWQAHKFDWLIASMAHYEGWTLVTDDRDPPFAVPGLETLSVEAFVARYLQ